MSTDGGRDRPPETAGRHGHRFETLTDAMVDGVVVIDEQCIVRSFNPSAQRMFGYLTDEVIGRNVNMLMPEPYHGEHDGYVARYRDTGDARIIGIGREVSGRRNDGTVFPMHLSVGEMPTDEGPYFVGIIRDLSAEKQTEAGLREHEEQLAGIAANLPGPIFRRIQHTDGSLSFSFVSDGLHRYFDIDPEAVKVDPDVLIRAIHPDDRRGWHEALRESAENMTPYDYRMRVTGSGGQTKWMHAIARPYRRASGDIVWDGLALDITDQRIAEQQLRQAQKMEAIGQLTGGVAHDFNNLLAVMMMDLESLAEIAADRPDAVELIEEVAGAARSAADLTHSLLAFARRQDLKPEITDLNDLVSRSTALIRRVLGEEIEIDTVLGHDLWPAFVDASQLENALLNLAINARDAMKGGGRLVIELKNTVFDDDLIAQQVGVAAGDYVVLCMTDIGTGMPPEVLDKAFEPFFTTKETGSGTGLGLSMVYGFARQSNGHVTIYSEVGRGTTVRLYLPRAGAEKVGSRAEKTDDIPGGTEIILLVEDFAQLRRRTARILIGLGYEVIEAENGNDALAKLEAATRVDLLFTDVVMPGGMDGPALAELARRRDPNLKVLYASGYAEHAQSGNGFVEPGAVRLAKPYSRRDLATAIRSALGDGAAST